jgi:hypothetical protein
MIEKINFYRTNNDNYIKGYDYQYEYMINYNNILSCYDLNISYLPIRSFKLTSEDINLIKKLSKTCLVFDNNKSAIKYFNRNKIINSIIND